MKQRRKDTINIITGMNKRLTEINVQLHEEDALMNLKDDIPS